MKLPVLNELNTSRDIVDVFGGYNHNLRISDGEFYDMENLTSTFYPILSPRGRRGTFAEDIGYKPVGMIEKDSLCYVYQKEMHLYFVMNGYEHDLGVIKYSRDADGNEIDENTPRILTSMGAYVIIMPDKKYINTKNTEDKGDIEQSFTSVSGENVKFEICRADGTVYKVDKISPNEPTETDDGAEIPNGYVWLDTSSTPNSLKVYSKTNAMWASVATTYIRITATGLGAAFNEYDGVTISGVTVESIKEDINSTMYIYAIPDDDSIVVVGLLGGSNEAIQEEAITVERLMPDMDFIIENNNRLWGCRYGPNRNGDVVNELYACKLGDFKNWNCYPGIATDSYYVQLGTDGQFTGAIAYLGQPLFFKENCLHMVYGNYPAEYQVQDTACRGVQRGSSNSLAMVNEVLYYKSRTGVCAYSGSLPTEVSSAFGQKVYTDAIACAHKGKYYISMKESGGKYVMFVLDTEKGLWHKEDSLQAIRFCPVDEEIYYIEAGDPSKIKTIFGSGEMDSRPVKWMAETGILGCTSPDKKYISRISLRISMDINARLMIFIEYDSSGVWEPVSTIMGHNLYTFTLPITPKRCDHFRLRFEGEGLSKIFSITKITEQGSDV